MCNCKLTWQSELQSLNCCVCWTKAVISIKFAKYVEWILTYKVWNFGSYAYHHGWNTEFYGLFLLGTIITQLICGASSLHNTTVLRCKFTKLHFFEILSILVKILQSYYKNAGVRVLLGHSVAHVLLQIWLAFIHATRSNFIYYFAHLLVIHFSDNNNVKVASRSVNNIVLKRVVGSCWSEWWVMKLQRLNRDKCDVTDQQTGLHARQSVSPLRVCCQRAWNIHQNALRQRCNEPDVNTLRADSYQMQRLRYGSTLQSSDKRQTGTGQWHFAVMNTTYLTSPRLSL